MSSSRKPYGKLYVNFDMELLQLIREAKYPDRMGIEIPESAKIVLFQEEKLKSYMYYNELSWASSEYEAALQRHGVQAPLRHGQQRLEQLVTNIYDIIQRRVEKNLRIGSRTLLVDLPADESFTVMDFVAMRKSHIGEKGGILQGKNVEIEHAVDDLVKIIVNYQFDTTTKLWPRRSSRMSPRRSPRVCLRRSPRRTPRMNHAWRS